jgi:hypothetical protein
MIDFQYGKDLSLTKSTPCVPGDDCSVMANPEFTKIKSPKDFQADLFGLCDVVHYLLHGTSLKISFNNGTYSPSSQFKVYEELLQKFDDFFVLVLIFFDRFWQKTMWTSIFEKCLNFSQPTMDLTVQQILFFVKMEIGQYFDQNEKKKRILSIAVSSHAAKIL